MVRRVSPKIRLKSLPQLRVQVRFLFEVLPTLVTYVKSRSFEYVRRIFHAKVHERVKKSYEVYLLVEILNKPRSYVIYLYKTIFGIIEINYVALEVWVSGLNHFFAKETDLLTRVSLVRIQLLPLIM